MNKYGNKEIIIQQTGIKARDTADKQTRTCEEGPGAGSSTLKNSRKWTAQTKKAQ